MALYGEWHPPEEFEEYRLVRQLGSGAMGEVYLAHDQALDRLVAVKFVTRYQDARARERFLVEARAAARVQHPNVVTVHRVGQLGDHPYIVSEFVRGTSLDRIRKPVDWKRALELGIGLARGLAAAHEQRVLHRDIKPANSILRETGEPVLVDFGLAKLADSSGAAAAGIGEDPTTGRVSVRNSTTGGRSGALAEDETVSLDSERDRAESAPASGKGTQTDGLAATLAVETRAESSGSARASDSERLGRSPKPSAEITRAGAIMGTPYYMSPEAWRGEPATARSDIYSFGALLYEMCAGHPPHRGVSQSELAQVVAERDAPRLASLVPGIDQRFADIVHTCLARDPAERFGAADDLRTALEELAEGRRPLPKLDEKLENELLDRAPQPLAEAVSALGASRNAHQAGLALRQVVRVAARYLGLISLACRSRSGSGASGGDSPHVVEAARALRLRGLSEPQWIELAWNLCRPFAGKREAHPIPELVALLCANGDSGPPALLDEVAALAAEPDSELSDDQAHAHLAERLPGLAKLLERLLFVTKYPLAVPHAGAVESWMGPRRLQRRLLDIAAGPLPDRRPLLVNSQGGPVVSLWPLVQVARPSPGAAPELFMLAGKGRHAARLVALPAGFEREDDEPWVWLRDQLLESASETEQLLRDQLVPYRGLLPFSADDADVFFGREGEADAFRNRLRVQPMMAVVGPSGAGKSSFVQAGVTPDLPGDWRVAIMRPGPEPIRALLACLAPEGAAEIRERDGADVDALAASLRAACAEGGGTTLVVVDQLEELFTLCADADERRLFAETLGALSRSLGSLRVLLTLRDDFLFRAEGLPGLRPAMTEGLWLLGTPPPDDLVRILVEPARRAGYVFEDPTLPQEMVDQVADKPGALALLSFTASKLWELRDRHFRRLPRQAYSALGGVGGALAQHAEETLAKRPKEDQRLVRAAFRRLITSEGTRAVLTRTELLQVLGDDERARAVLEHLIHARLIVASEAEKGEERVEIIHEALLAAWPRLVRWQREDAEGARLRDQLRAAARQWRDRGRPRGLLWRDDALAEYRLWRSRHPGSLTDIESEFAAASLADAARGRRARRLVVGAIVAILAAATLMLYFANQRTGDARRLAEVSAATAQERLAEQYLEQGRQRFLAGDPLLALLYLGEAHKAGASGAALEYLASATLRAFEPERAVLRGHTQGLTALEVSPDSERIVTTSTDGTARIWDASNGAALITIAAHDSGVWYAEFSPDGKRLLTLGRDNTPRLWDAANGELLLTLEGHEAEPLCAAFSHGGRKVATGSLDGAVRIWDSVSGETIRVLSGHKLPLQSIAFSPDGSRFVVASADRTVTIWRLSDGSLLRRLEGHTDVPIHAEFSADGSRVLTASWDKTARLWDVETGAMLVTFKGHKAALRMARLLPDGEHVVTAGDDSEARIWDAKTGIPLHILRGHLGGIWDIDISPDGGRIATASADGSIRVWDADTGTELAHLVGHQDLVTAVRFLGNGTRLASASNDRTARLWEARASVLLATLTHSPEPVEMAGYSPNGELIVSTGKDGTVKLWDASTGKLRSTLTGHQNRVYNASFDESGSAMATSSQDGTARIWNVADGSQRRVIESGSGMLLFADLDPSGARVVTAGAEPIAKVWSVRDGRLQLSLEGHSDWVFCARFSPDGRRIVTSSQDKTLRVWDAATGAHLGTLDGAPLPMTRFAFSSDGTALVTAGLDRTARIWHIASRHAVATLEGHSQYLNSAEFSGDGRFVITSSNDRTARIWDAKRGVPLHVLLHPDWVHAAGFSPDGTRAVTASQDGRIRIWNVTSAHADVDRLRNAARCRVPYAIRAGRLVRTEIDLSACSAAPTERRSR